VALAARAALDILAQTDDWVAVAKPAGLATIPGRGEDDSVLERLGRQLGLPSGGSLDARVRVVHRLDKHTSGVLLFAKHAAAQRHLSHQFQNNAVRKEYLALVVGRPSEQHGEVDAPLARHPVSPQRMAVVRHGGRPARTAWRVDETFRQFTLLRVFPRTGKTHQIRVHLQSVGMPLAIDPLYNAPRGGGGLSETGLLLSSFKRGYRPAAGEVERPLIERLTLHAQKLGFKDVSGADAEVEAPLPKDFRSALNMLRKYDR
jgi:23S rRNA pseudouridine955/2504/2580 synthase/23S rRNA pseudouridine1911/1915/1917 synthase